MKPLWLFYINTAITLLAANMSRYSVLLFTRETTGSDSMAGLVFATSFVPILLFGAQAGVFADRHDRKKIIIAAQILITVAVASFAIGFDTPDTVRWSGFALIYSFLLGLALTFMLPARFAFVGNLVEDANVPKSSAVVQVIIIAGFGLAPLATGLLKTFFNWRDFFFATAALYFIGIFFIMPVKPAFKTIKQGEGVTLRDGFKFVWSTPRIRDLLVLVAVGIFLLGPVQVVLPHFSKEHFNLTEASRGTFVSMLGFGLLLGGILGRIGNPKRRRGTIAILCGMITGVASALLVKTTDVRIASVLLFTAGVSGGVLSTLISSGLQANAPDHFRGRVMSLYSMTVQVVPALAGIAVAQISERMGAQDAFISSGLFVLISSTLCAFLPGLRTPIDAGLSK